MKRIAGILIVVVIAVSAMLSACAPSTPSAPSTTTPTQPTAPTQTPTTAPAQAKMIKWVGQTSVAAGGALPDQQLALAKKVTEASGGRLQLDLVTAGGIVPAQQEFDGVHSGAIQFASAQAFHWLDKFPQAGLFGYLIDGLSPMEFILWHLDEGLPLMQRMIDDYNVHAEIGTIEPPELFLSSNKAINSLADLKGLKIRTAGDDGVLFTNMGAAVVNIPAGEIYESMNRGVIDAYQVASPGTDWGLKLNEVVKHIYVSPVRQPGLCAPWIFNKQAWAELPDDLKLLVKEMFLADTLHFYGKIALLDIQAAKDFKDYGVTVEPMAADVVAEMMKQADLLYAERAAKDPFYAEVLSSIQDFKTTIREVYPRL